MEDDPPSLRQEERRGAVRPREGDNDGNTDDEGPATTKKLRSTENDLKIIVGGSDDDRHDDDHDDPNNNNNNNNNKNHHHRRRRREFMCNSAVMASHSQFIDIMLANPMQESLTREIALPDVEPEQWEMVLKYLVPKESRKMTLGDAVAVLPLYDKYAFPEGRELCEQVIIDFFDNEKKELENENRGEGVRVALNQGRRPEQVDLLVDAFDVTVLHNLSTKAKESAYGFFKTVLKEKHALGGRLMFGQEHLQKLVPLIRKVMKGKVSFLLAPDDDPRALLGCPEASDEELENPLFPKMLLNVWKAENERSFWSANLKSITLVGSALGGVRKAKIRFYPSSDVGGMNPGFLARLERSEVLHFENVVIRNLTLPSKGIRGWTILGFPTDHTTNDRHNQALWTVPSSSQHPLPPMEGWINIQKEQGNDTTSTTSTPRPPKLYYEWERS